MAIFPQLCPMRHLFLVLHAYFGQKSELWQQVICQFPTAMPRYGRHAPRLFGPFVLYGSYSQKIWQSLHPPNKSGPGRRQPVLILFKYLAWFPMPSGHLTRAANVPNAQSRSGTGTYGTFSACLCHPLCPKSKWHVPPPAYGFAYGSYSQLCQSLCPPNGSKPN